MPSSMLVWLIAYGVVPFFEWANQLNGDIVDGSELWGKDFSWLDFIEISTWSVDL